MRKKGFPLGNHWYKDIRKFWWNRWDKLTQEERASYEKFYEDKDNTRIRRCLDTLDKVKNRITSRTT